MIVSIYNKILDFKTLFELRLSKSKLKFSYDLEKWKILNFLCLIILWSMPSGECMDKGKGYDNMIGYATCNLSQHFM